MIWWHLGEAFCVLAVIVAVADAYLILAPPRSRRRQGSCTCDPQFYGIAADGGCPDHGLAHHLQLFAAEQRLSA